LDEEGTTRGNGEEKYHEGEEIVSPAAVEMRSTTWVKREYRQGERSSFLQFNTVEDINTKDIQREEESTVHHGG
jgi:beta-galactosidase/beta-glucuronidase